jgi:hypothetical protein
MDIKPLEEFPNALGHFIFASVPFKKDEGSPTPKYAFSNKGRILHFPFKIERIFLSLLSFAIYVCLVHNNIFLVFYDGQRSQVQDISKM